MKIFYIMECRECRHNMNLSSVKAGMIQLNSTCIEAEKKIPDIETIPDWCPLEDAAEFIEWEKENEKNNQANLGKP